MSSNTFQQWMYLDPMSQQTGGVNGSASKTFPIAGNGPEPWFRDRLDGIRSARIPTAEFPDGYLGTTRTRREDRLTHGGARQTKKNYERGVHVGARVDPQSYLWDANIVHPMAGLEAQARGEKWTASMAEGFQVTHPAGVGTAGLHLTNGGKPMPRGSQSLVNHPGASRFNDPRLRPRYR